MQRLLEYAMSPPGRIGSWSVRYAEPRPWRSSKPGIPGNQGGLATVHANDAAAGLLRLAQLIEEGLQGGKADPAVIAAAVGLVVVRAKVSTAPGHRITEMLSVKGHEDGRYVFEPILSAS